MFVIGISNIIGVEALEFLLFNEYSRPVRIVASNDLVMRLVVTNDAGAVLYSTNTSQVSAATKVLSPGQWNGFPKYRKPRLGWGFLSNSDQCRPDFCPGFGLSQQPTGPVPNKPQRYV